MVAIARVVIAIIAALLTAGSMMSDVLGFLGEQPWSLYALIGFVVFAGIVCWGWSASELSLYRSRKREQRLTALSTLRRKGIMLLNEGIAKVRHEKQALEHWWERVSTWQNEVKETMRSINSADPENWEDVGVYNVTSFNNVSDPLALRFLTQLSIRLDRLHNYVNERTKQVG